MSRTWGSLNFPTEECLIITERGGWKSVLTLHWSKDLFITLFTSKCEQILQQRRIFLSMEGKETFF